jgi:hypothetical protein
MSDQETRVKAKIDAMDPNEKALFVSKHLMQVEWALESLKPDVEKMRKAADSPAMASGYCQMLQGYHLIKAGHQSLTIADAGVFARPIPASR